MNKEYVAYTVGYYAVIKKNEKILFAATWMELEVSETEKDKHGLCCA